MVMSSSHFYHFPRERKNNSQTAQQWLPSLLLNTFLLLKMLKLSKKPAKVIFKHMHTHIFACISLYRSFKSIHVNILTFICMQFHFTSWLLVCLQLKIGLSSYFLLLNFIYCDHNLYIYILKLIYIYIYIFF